MFRRERFHPIHPVEAGSIFSYVTQDEPEEVFTDNYFQKAHRDVGLSVDDWVFIVCRPGAKRYKFLATVVRANMESVVVEAVASLEHGLPQDNEVEPPSDVEGRVNMVADAMRRMNSPKHFRKDGKPDKRALNMMVGFSVSNEDYEKAWSFIKAEKETA